MLVESPGNELVQGTQYFLGGVMGILGLEGTMSNSDSTSLTQESNQPVNKFEFCKAHLGRHA